MITILVSEASKLLRAAGATIGYYDNHFSAIKGSRGFKLVREFTYADTLNSLTPRDPLLAAVRAFKAKS